MHFLYMTLFLFVTSCSLFRHTPSLTDKSPDQWLDSVRLTGEGRGRLTLGQNQYVFSMESVLNENKDWILAVAIPLQGEEVMILPDLSKSQIDSDETESFEERIEKEFQALKLNRILTAREFLVELRSLVRFVLTKEWGGMRDCKAQQNEVLCVQDTNTFVVSTSGKMLNIKKSLGDEKSLQLVAGNLTDSIFKKIDIVLIGESITPSSTSKNFSLELFW